MIPSWKWTRKYCFSKIPVIKGVYKPLFFTEYLVIMLLHVILQTLFAGTTAPVLNVW